MPAKQLHKAFIAALKEVAEESAISTVSRFFHFEDDHTTRVLGVSIGKVFPVARRFADMPLSEIDRLLDSVYYEVRMGAVSVMDFQARAKGTSADQRKALFELYLSRHDRINNWDLGRSCRSICGWRLPCGQAARHSLQAGPLAKPVGASNRYGKHLLLYS